MNIVRHQLGFSKTENRFPTKGTCITIYSRVVNSETSTGEVLKAVSEPELAEDVGGRFDYVLVDEYQDTNRLQAAILMSLKPGGRGLTVVGDDA